MSNEQRIHSMRKIDYGEPPRVESPPSLPMLAITIDLSHLDSLMKEHIRERCHTDTIDEGILRGFYLCDLLLWMERKQEREGMSGRSEEGDR